MAEEKKTLMKWLNCSSEFIELNNKKVMDGSVGSTKGESKLWRYVYRVDN